MKILKCIRFVFMALLSGCLYSAQAKLTVVTTTTMVTDMVQSVGGDTISLIPMMGPGVDPHLYKPSASDLAKLRKASVIFYNGLMLEGRMADVFSKMARRGAKVYAVTENIAEEALLEPEAFEGHWDPHVWFDPELWVQCVDVVVTGLSEADPKNAALYSKNGDKVKERYSAVNAWAKKRVALVPEKQRILITSHDAFNYFGQAFGFKVIAVQGISTTSEAGLADISNTVDFIKANNVKAIFVESSVSPAAIKRISKDSGVKVGGELFSDAMGLPGQIEKGPDGERYDVGTWPGMMRHNINSIVENLK